MIEVEWDDGALRELLDRLAGAPPRAVELAAQELWGNVREESPVDHGRLAGSWQLEKRGDDAWAVVSGVEYALAVHEGRPPQEIVPVHASALRFTVGGEVVFAKRVEHPGTPGDRYADRAIDRTASRVPEFVRIALAEVGA